MPEEETHTKPQELDSINDLELLVEGDLVNVLFKGIDNEIFTEELVFLEYDSDLKMVGRAPREKDNYIIYTFEKDDIKVVNGGIFQEVVLYTRWISSAPGEVGYNHLNKVAAGKI